MNRKKLESFFAALPAIRCLVIGDLMLDEYLWGKAERISPEAPVQIVDVTREELRLGGAGNVANNLSELGVQVSVCSVIGDDENGNALLDIFVNKHIATNPIFRDPARRTSRKTRVVAAHQQIIRIDRESRAALSPDMERSVCAWIENNISKYNIILLSDYLKGVLTSRVLSTTFDTALKAHVPVLVDPKGSDFIRYNGATILTPNKKEAEAASGITIRDADSLELAAATIMKQVGLEYLLITRSEEGMSLFSSKTGSVHIPTVAREVFDVSGAGDTVIAALAAGMAAGADILKAAELANVAAGIAVNKLGTSTVTPTELINAMAYAANYRNTKIRDCDALAVLMEAEKSCGKKIVFTNGCFDLLHAGHVKYLQKARLLGDILVLGLNSDASVRRLKGEKRPLIGEDERAQILSALDCVDYVVIFEEDTPIKLISAIKPDILAKGGDYAPDAVVGKELVESYGGKLELVSFVDGKSTTNIIEKVLERYS